MNGNLHINKKSPNYKSIPADDRFNPVFAYLIEHPKKGFLLIDTGLHASFSEKRFGNFGLFLGSMAKTKTEKGLDVVSQIKSIHVRPDEIDKIILSHLHLDHVSGLQHFMKNDRVKVFIDPDEIDAGKSFGAVMKGYVKKHYSDVQLYPIQYSLKPKPLFFDHVWDVYGDQSVFVMKTAGHTPGHISALLNMSGGPVFLTFDAAHRKSNIEEGVPPRGDYEKALASINNIKALSEMMPEMRIIYGHDPDQLGSLKLLPDYYT